MRTLKILMFLALVSCGFCRISEGFGIKLSGDVNWPSEWVIFAPADKETPILSVDKLKTVPEEITVGGKTLKFRKVSHDGGRLDFNRLSVITEPGQVAYVFLKLDSDEKQDVPLLLRANCLIQVWINGKNILDTVETGDLFMPPKISNHLVQAKLRSGQNVLALRVVSVSDDTFLSVRSPGNSGSVLTDEAIERAFVPGAHIRELVVAPNGSDDNPGTEKRPFASIKKAAEVARAGDMVIVRAGVYREHVVFPNSGEPGKPIIFSGQRGLNGEWLTVVDAGVEVSGWIPAPEIGPGVYKTDELPFNPWCMTVNGKQMARIADRLMLQDRDKLLPLEQLQQIGPALKRQREDGIGGFNLLRIPADAVSDTLYVKEMNYWDGVEALYGHLEGVTYIRFRHGDDPRGKNINASPRGNAFLLDNRSHIVLKNFLIRGAEMSVIIQGEEATNNIVAGNHMMHGRTRVYLTGGAARNLVQNNRLTLNYFGHESPGAWGMVRYSDLAKIRCHIYQEFKHTVSAVHGSDDRGIWAVQAGPDNVIRDNRIYGGLIGISVTRTSRLHAYRNIIHNMSSIGILTSGGVYDSRFHDNLIYDCNINLRIHQYDTPGLARREYHYRNISLQPEGMGGHIYVHCSNQPWPGEPDDPEIFLYHNTYSGGLNGMGISGWLLDKGGMRRTVLVNNVFSSPGSIVGGARRRDIPEMFEAVDYNWMGPPVVDKDQYPEWFGKNNILSETHSLWSAESSDLSLPKDSPARYAGIDLSTSFILVGKEYPALPGMVPGYFDGDNPDMGALQEGRGIDKCVSMELGKLSFR